MFNAPQQLVAFNQAQINNAVKFANVSLEGAARLIDLQINVAREILEDGVKNVKALGSIKDIQDVSAFQSAIAEPGLQRFLAYSRNVYEVIAQTQNEIKQLVEEQIAEFNKSVVVALDNAVKSAPGSEVFVAAVKTAISNANVAYDTIAKANKQVVDLAEANLNAAASAIGGEAEAKKRAAK